MGDIHSAMTLPLYFTSSTFSDRIKKVLSKKAFEIFRGEKGWYYEEKIDTTVDIIASNMNFNFGKDAPYSVLSKIYFNLEENRGPANCY